MTSAELIKCETTADCRNLSSVPMICYDNPAFSEEDHFCECNNWYGWTGEACDQESPQLHYFRASSCLVILWSVLIMLHVGRTAIFHIKYWIIPKKSAHPIFFTGLLVFLGSLCLFLNSAIQLWALIDHSRFKYSENANLEERLLIVTVKGGEFGSDCYYFATCFHVLVSLHILVSWNEIVGSTTKFYPDMFCISAVKMKRFIRIILVIQIIILFVLTQIENNALVSGYLLFIGVLLGVIYITNYRRVMRALQKLKEIQNHKLQRAVFLVNISFRITATVIALFCLTGFVWIYFYTTYENTVKPGNVNVAVVMRDFLIWYGLMLTTFNAWFVLETTRNIMGPRTRDILTASKEANPSGDRIGEHAKDVSSRDGTRTKETANVAEFEYALKKPESNSV